ncbi:unnamed protein product [Spirodela intermedia]|uniref:Uncharacterized protein n=1 Tax=Spirodela intermedia TaxID=51605 RepID=A0ABN7E7W2_SPIIN|nr:unnamed protein product [Spirodela intermedia]
MRRWRGSRWRLPFLSAAGRRRGFASQRLEHALHLPVAFFICRFFAFANTGVHL